MTLNSDTSETQGDTGDRMNGNRPACLYNDPSVFVKTEFDTGKKMRENC